MIMKHQDWRADHARHMSGARHWLRHIETFRLHRDERLTIYHRARNALSCAQAVRLLAEMRAPGKGRLP